MEFFEILEKVVVYMNKKRLELLIIYLGFIFFICLLCIICNKILYGRNILSWKK